MYDPDPIASLRKRRVSTDSHDSTASHGDLRSKEDQIVAAARKSSKLADNSFPMEAKKKNKSGEKVKKKHKKCSKHGHHHCHKHKHKRHKSGGEVVASSSSKKTHDQKFAIRSPPHPGSRFVKSDQENNESSEEASQEESDQQNSSDDEVSFSYVFFFKWKVVWTDANRREAGFLLPTTLNSINWVRETKLLPVSPFSHRAACFSLEGKVLQSSPTTRHTFLI